MMILISKNKRTFRGFAETYKVKIINDKNLSDLLSVIKNSIKKLFDELLREKRGFKYIISVKITLKKRINDNEFNLKTLYFNSLIKTVIYINVANYEPLFHYQKYWTMKDLINLKNKDRKCFMWCHVGLINLTNSHPEKINKQDKKIAANLNYSDIAFLLGY